MGCGMTTQHEGLEAWVDQSEAVEDASAEDGPDACCCCGALMTEASHALMDRAWTVRDQNGRVLMVLTRCEDCRAWGRQPAMLVEEGV